MKTPILTKNANIINEVKNFVADVLIEQGIISCIGKLPLAFNYKIIDATGKYLLPGVIDAQVHFREPGLTHKDDTFSESKAAISGGVTSFIDMPNTILNVLITEILDEKFSIASERSFTPGQKLKFYTQQ